MLPGGKWVAHGGIGRRDLLPLFFFLPVGCRRPIISSEAWAPPAAYRLCLVSSTEACGPDECNRPSASGLLLSSSTTGHGFSPSVGRACSLHPRHLSTPNQLIYSSRLPLCQSLGPSLTNVLNLFPVVCLDLRAVHGTWHRWWDWKYTAQFTRGLWDQAERGGGEGLCRSHRLSRADVDAALSFPCCLLLI